MFIGIDLGTSAVKIVLVDDRQRIVSAVEEALNPVQPRPGWSEDDPDEWWRAIERGMGRLAAAQDLAAVLAVGLSGQMHGALLLDGSDRPVRPVILWNDGRAASEAAELARDAGLQHQLGVLSMPGFTAPKLLWLARHEPAAFGRARHLLLPKDYIRLKLSGEYATDVVDASGAWLVDQARRRWSMQALAACGTDPAWLPRLCESPEPTGQIRPTLAARWGMGPGVTIAAGAGDVAAGGVGIGHVAEGQAFLSLGTSAQIFVSDAAYRPNPDRLVHAFCHALPRTWFRMAALLNGASPLAAAARWLGQADIRQLLEETERHYTGPSALLALPYLTGERTPHNDPHARGVIFGLGLSTQSTDIVQAFLEGVAFSLADGLAVLEGVGPRLDSLAFIGGGTRSAFWGRIIAAVLGVTLIRYQAAERGPAFGAARLARLSISGEDPAAVATKPPIDGVIVPDPALQDAYAARLPAFRALYQALRKQFRHG